MANCSLVAVLLSMAEREPISSGISMAIRSGFTVRLVMVEVSFWGVTGVVGLVINRCLLFSMRKRLENMIKNMSLAI